MNLIQFIESKLQRKLVNFNNILYVMMKKNNRIVNGYRPKHERLKIKQYIINIKNKSNSLRTYNLNQIEISELFFIFFFNDYYIIYYN